MQVGLFTSLLESPWSEDLRTKHDPDTTIFCLGRIGIVSHSLGRAITILQEYTIVLQSRLSSSIPDCRPFLLPRTILRFLAERPTQVQINED